jgi:hypothetical protein
VKRRVDGIAAFPCGGQQQKIGVIRIDVALRPKTTIGMADPCAAIFKKRQEFVGIVWKRLHDARGQHPVEASRRGSHDVRRTVRQEHVERDLRTLRSDPIRDRDTRTFSRHYSSCARDSQRLMTANSPSERPEKGQAEHPRIVTDGDAGHRQRLFECVLLPPAARKP